VYRSWQRKVIVVVAANGKSEQFLSMAKSSSSIQVSGIGLGRKRDALKEK